MRWIRVEEKVKGEEREMLSGRENKAYSRERVVSERILCKNVY